MEQSTVRRHYLDWTRVLAFLLLIFFHCAMPFVVFGWEIKNKETSIPLSRFVWWLHQWHIPLLFFISSVGVHYSLRNRTIGAFARERFVRLFIPLAFAMLFTIPFQVYFEWMQTGRISQSYASFYPSVWKFIPYPDGSLTWSHMWFVVYLFVFCFLLLPVFAMFKIPFMARVKQATSAILSNGLTSAVLFIPLMIIYYGFYLQYPEQLNLLSDWFVFLFSLTLFFYGYFIGGSDRFWQSCERFRYIFLVASGVCIFLLYRMYWWNFELPAKQDQYLYRYGLLNAMQIWFLILTILGFTKHHLNFSNRFLRYANTAVYPFYILHQTMIVIIGYYVTAWHMNLFLKLAILIVLCSLSLFLLYHFIIRRFAVTRILYGVKSSTVRKAKPVKVAPVALLPETT